MECLGLVCGGPVMVLAYLLWARAFRSGKLSARQYRAGFWIAGMLICSAMISEGAYLMGEQLVSSSCKGDLQSVRRLLRLGINPNFQTDERMSPLQCAEENGKEEVARALRAAGATR